MSDLEQDIIQVLLKHDVINERALRNFRVKTRYKLLQEGGLTAKQAREKLADEELVCEKTIQKILYGKK